MISHQRFAKKAVKKFCVTSVQSVPHRVDVTLEEFDQDKRD